jgi:hypothetical protein
MTNTARTKSRRSRATLLRRRQAPAKFLLPRSAVSGPD